MRDEQGRAPGTYLLISLFLTMLELTLNEYVYFILLELKELLFNLIMLELYFILLYFSSLFELILKELF